MIIFSSAIVRYYNFCALAAFMAFWALFWRPLTFLSNSCEAPGSCIPSKTEETSSADKILGNHIWNHCWLLCRASSLNYGWPHLLLALSDTEQWLWFSIWVAPVPPYKKKKSKILPCTFFCFCQMPEANP